MSPIHVTILASPGLGHLIPILEFAKRIVTFDDINVSLFVLHTDASPVQLELLGSMVPPKGLEIVDIPAVDISSFVDQDAHVLTRICVITRESLPHIESVIVARSRPTVLVVDLFSMDALDMVADNLCIKKYIFFPSNAATLAFMMYLPTLDQEVDGEFIHLLEPVCVPGCNPIHVDDLVEPVRNRNVEAYTRFLYQASRYHIANGILVNTCEDLEPVSLKALRDDPILCQIPTPRVFPVGPLIKVDKPLVKSNAELMTWLDTQPNDSVLFVSFGSGGTLSAEQLTELAWGLELSQQRFIWVVQKPIETNNTSGTFFNVGGEQNNPSYYLPDGFLGRIKGLGLVVPSWAPQVEILAHKSTGGFLSHCGWNSTLESIFHGVPIIAWPLYAEQKMNATMLVEELGVAVRPVVDHREKEEVVVVGREEIERVVRLHMEGEHGNALRARVKEIKTSVVKALEEGGSSYDSMSKVLEEWKTNCIVDKEEDVC